jgi:hypothetical protein
MAKHFGLSPDQFGENLLLMYKVAALVHATCTVTMFAFEWMKDEYKPVCFVGVCCAKLFFLIIFVVTFAEA